MTRIRWDRLAVGLVSFFAAACVTHTDYYASPSGSDVNGDGSSARPWRTIQHAIDHVDRRKPNPRVNLAAGQYDGKIIARDSITLRGAGARQVTLRGTGTEDFIVTVDGSAATRRDSVGLTLLGLTIHGRASANPGVQAKRAVLFMKHVRITQPGWTSVDVDDSPAFTMTDCEIETGPYWSDLGVDLDETVAVIDGLMAGDRIDHIVNVRSDCIVTIKNSKLVGSKISWADGIRVLDSSTVDIRNTSIVRPAGGQTPGPNSQHNRPYAGIELSVSRRSGSPQRTVRVRDCTISGFDVGLGVNLQHDGVMVENTRVSGLTAAVDTYWPVNLPVKPLPAVDLGGGALGSVGRNVFGTSEKWAVYHRAPYDVYAKHNVWGVRSTKIDDRVRDRLDDKSLGRVQR